MPRKKQIRNSTAEFLIFSAQSGGDELEVRYEDETIWLTQKLMARLFDVDIRTISEHLGNIFDQGEIERDATIRKFRIVQKEGSREVTREIDHYSLDAIISVGYRVNSVRATQFRQRATSVLRDFAIKGYVLDRKRMENGAFLDEDYFERLLEEIREKHRRLGGVLDGRRVASGARRVRSRAAGSSQIRLSDRRFRRSPHSSRRSMRKVNSRNSVCGRISNTNPTSTGK